LNTKKVIFFIKEYSIKEIILYSTDVQHFKDYKSNKALNFDKKFSL
jgi:hypothetical protein